MRRSTIPDRVTVLELRVKTTSMALTCAVKSCSNGAYWLNKWKNQLCESCGCLHKEKLCRCEPPFRLFTFPTKKKNPERRERWKQLIGRRDGNKLWSPSKDSRVCSRHFVDTEPTLQNPLPTLNLGYDGADKRVKRIGFFDGTDQKPKMIVKDVSVAAPCENTKNLPEDPELEYLQPSTEIPGMISFMTAFIAVCLSAARYKKKVDDLLQENMRLKMEIKQLKGVVYTEKILKTDDDVNFYTGLTNRSMFDKLHSFIAPFVNRRWTGVTSAVRNIRNFKKTPSRFGPERKMTSKSEFLMMLMKLRLGLLNKDLAKRFNISETLCSRIFLAWLRACSIVLKPLVYVPDLETLIGSKPDRFRSLPDLFAIIDCTEMFIETPKDLYLQSSTWSDYKHHNTVKLLVACAPNSNIIYTSPAYTGRISDKALTMDCGFLDQVPPHSMIMADKGFNIENECAERNISLHVPPGKRGHSQMSTAYIQKTKKIANHRILIEQVIRRLKTFRILANEIALSLIGHIDDIVTVCSALCNFREPIYKT